MLIRTPYGRTIMGPLGRLYADRGYQVVVQSCRGTFGSGGAFASRCATSRWTARRRSTGWRRSPGSTAASSCGAPSYLGMAQWAVAQDAPDFLRALGLQVTAANIRDAIVYPGGAFALETGLAWMYELKHQERGGARCCGPSSGVPRSWRRRAKCCPWGSVTWRPSAEPMDFYQEWLEHSTPGDGWWDEVDFGRRLENVPPASFIGGWYDLFLRAQVDDYEALRHAGRSARLTIGPWTHGSPGLFAETVRDGPRWFDQPARGGAGRTRRTPGRAGPRLRHGLAHVA